MPCGTPTPTPVLAPQPPPPQRTGPVPGTGGEGAPKPYACGAPRLRRSNRPAAPRQINTGYSVNGSFAEYAPADPAYVGHLLPSPHNAAPPLRDRKFADSSVEGDGFEPSVPQRRPSPRWAPPQVQASLPPQRAAYSSAMPCWRPFPVSSNRRRPYGSGPSRR